MADVLKRLVGPIALTTSAVTQYTAPAATTSVMRNIHVANESSVTALFTISIGADGAGKRIFYQQAVGPQDSFDWTGNIVLAAAELVQAYATSTSLTLTISGLESS